MGYEWEIVEPRPVLEDRRVRFPNEVRRKVGRDHPNAGPSVYWNYEKHSNFIVLSNAFLTQENYEDAGRTKTLFPDEEEAYAKIRAPKGLGEPILSVFYKDALLFYLAYEEMVTGDIRSVYLLTRQQVKGLLPQESTGEDPDNLKDRILNTPGLLSSYS